MTKIAYIEKNFRRKSLEQIDQANEIIEEYQAQGYSLTLRQLYYQFVARDLLDNTQKNYSNLGNLINDARMAGYIDWFAIEDRTRGLKSLSHWEDVTEIIGSSAASFRLDKWEDQDVMPEVWVEKEALAGVFARVCNELDIPYFSCRGYASASSLWRASLRMIERDRERRQRTVILHFGDHDPSGLDMTRDIEDRLATFTVSNFEVRRLALNMDQIEEYDPPPNPAKLSDSRARDYIRHYGRSSWELDALDPSVLTRLVRDEVEGMRDDDKYEAREQEEEESRTLLRKAVANWADVAEMLEGLEDV